ncbi:MAG: hypothetical protein IPM54_44970 [Polyangiaceae bacterium]|nr:hypothetical protein [Polyangiaceae bacterium]
MRGAMVGLLVSSLAFCGCASLFPSLFSPAVAGVEAFQFEASRVPVGIVYHYVKSNIDGSTPERISLYMSDQTTLEAYRWREPTPQTTFHVKATMDWDRLSAVRLESWRKVRFGGEQLNAVAEYSALTRVMSIEFSDKTRHTVAIDDLPFHFYQFDLASLNVAFRLLRDPKAPFRVGLVNPTFAMTGAALEYRGLATVTYEKDETHNEFPCRRYRIDGPGLKNKGGSIWVDKSEGHIIDLEIQLENHPDWTSFKLKFVGKETMDAAAWQAFMKSRFDAT